MSKLPAVVLLTLAATLHVGSGAAGERVIAIGGAVTEIVYALNAQDRLVAIDDTSMYPPRAQETLPSVGYFRALSAEPVLSLRPDLLLMVDNSGPPEVVAQLRRTGVRIVDVSEWHSMDGVYEKVAVIAEALGMEAQGAALNARLRAEYAATRTQVASLPGQPRVMFLLAAGRGALLAAGNQSAAHNMIELAGGVNVFADMRGYKSVTPEAIVAAAPEVIVVTQRTVDALGGIASLLQQADIAATPAGRSGRIVSYDDMYLLGFGPRTPAAIADLAARIH